MNNPYNWNVVNPSLFFGQDRQQLESEMCSHLAGTEGYPRLSFGLVGGRRMGKSTFLRKLQIDLVEKADKWRDKGLVIVPIYLDGSALPTPITPAYIWEFIYSKIEAVAPEDNSQLSLQNLDDLSSALRKTYTKFPTRPRVILLFDEIKWLIETEWGRGFRDNLRYLLTNSPDLTDTFSLVFAGALEMTELNLDKVSPVGNVLEWRRLKNLSFDDTSVLTQEPITHKWPKVFRQRIYQETGGHAMLVQYLMQKVCMSAYDEAEQSLEKAIEEFEQNQSNQFGYWWERYCTDNARRLYSCLPENRNETIAKSSLIRDYSPVEGSDALNTLESMGLVCLEQQGNQIRYSGEMFRKWYREKVVPNLAELADQSPAADVQADNANVSYDPRKERQTSSDAQSQRMVLSAIVVIFMLVTTMMVLTWAANQLSGFALVLVMAVGLVAIIVEILFVLVANRVISSRQAVSLYNKVLDLVPPLGKFLEKQPIN